MALSSNINNREFDKFEESSPGVTAVRVTGTNFSGTFRISGLNVGGLVTEVTLNDTTWTALPSSALANRNAISIQNSSAINIKINYSSGVSGYVGMTVGAGTERAYDITDNIVVYAKSESGTPTISVEELA